MLRFAITGLTVFMCLVLAAPHAIAQRAGQSATVRTGTVTAMRSVDLNDGNAVGGALVGGAFGAALTRSKKGSSRRDRNAAIGAVLGGAAAASKTRPGRVYTVTTNEGTMIQIATEQTEIRIDDCVFVQQKAGAGDSLRPCIAGGDEGCRDHRGDAGRGERVRCGEAGTRGRRQRRRDRPRRSQGQAPLLRLADPLSAR